MNSSDITATAELGLRLVVPERTAVPLVARLDYSADDPYAIRVAFHTGEDSPVEWIFARELLTVGIVRPVGEGDVRVCPQAPEHPTAEVVPARHVGVGRPGHLDGLVPV
ncbi:SsgA family sporulation/cell division regulator, partial [Nocardiopsis alba]|uniref:SsgA family sporulation/cell division regulator n=1 Tax=Nocardiopsis alba TaxID=53437 RepID=UPI003408C3CB